MTTHDALLKAIAVNPAEHTPRLVFADMLDENGKSGAKFIRAAVEHQRTTGSADGPFMSHRIRGEGVLPPWHDMATGAEDEGVGKRTPGATLLSLHMVTRRNPARGDPDFPMIASVYHTPMDKNDPSVPWVMHHAPVHSIKHLNRLLSDLPAGVRKQHLRRGFTAGLPATSTHDGPERLARKPESMAGEYAMHLNHMADLQEKGEPFDRTHARAFSDWMQDNGVGEGKHIILANAASDDLGDTTWGTAGYPHPELPGESQGRGGDLIPVSATVSPSRYSPLLSPKSTYGNSVQLFKQSPNPDDVRHWTDFRFAPVLHWQATIPASLSTTKKERRVHVTAPVTRLQLAEYVRTMSKSRVRTQWLDAMTRLGWLPEHPFKLARPPETADNATALENARTYHAANAERLGLPAWTGAPSALTIDKVRSRLAALAYRGMPHQPLEPATAASYAALKREVKEQYDHLVSRGVSFVRVHPNDYHGFKDIIPGARAGRMEYNRTLPEDMPADHPLMSQVPGHPEGTLHNDLLRAVHDYFGHAVHGHSFGPQGELRTWHEHAKLFSPAAQPALLAETHGQNSILNFSPEGSENLPITQRPYEPQKAGLIGEEHAPVKLARINGTASGVGQSQSKTHDTRLAILRHVLKEAQLKPSVVKAVLTASEGGLRPSVVATMLSSLSPEHVQYAAAWYGLLSGEKALTTFHPGEGKDTLHVLDSAHSPDQAGEYLRQSGVETFAVEHRSPGSRVYAVNLSDPEGLSRGLNASHSAINGTAFRLGTGSGADADAAASRSEYRKVIRAFEQANGV